MFSTMISLTHDFTREPGSVQNVVQRVLLAGNIIHSQWRCLLFILFCHKLPRSAENSSGFEHLPTNPAYLWTCFVSSVNALSNLNLLQYLGWGCEAQSHFKWVVSQSGSSLKSPEHIKQLANLDLTNWNPWFWGYPISGKPPLVTLVAPILGEFYVRGKGVVNVFSARGSHSDRERLGPGGCKQIV